MKHEWAVSSNSYDDGDGIQKLKFRLASMENAWTQTNETLPSSATDLGSSRANHLTPWERAWLPLCEIKALKPDLPSPQILRESNAGGRTLKKLQSSAGTHGIIIIHCSLVLQTQLHPSLHLRIKKD